MYWKSAVPLFWDTRYRDVQWKWVWLFSHESDNAQFEWSFKLRNLNDHSNDCILDRVYAKLHRDA